MASNLVSDDGCESSAARIQVVGQGVMFMQNSSQKLVVKRRKSGLYVLLLIVGLFVYASVSSYIADRPIFYRVKIEFDSRSQNGVLDAVVRCDVRARQTLSGEKYNEYFPDPVLYAVKLPDGSGVLARVGGAGACDRAWRQARGKPNGFRQGAPELPYQGIPRLTWLSDFNKRDYAEIYLGKESYEQAGANIRFKHAEVSAASEEEYTGWLESALSSKDEYIFSYNYFSPGLVVLGPPSLGPEAVNACFADIQLPTSIAYDSPALQNWLQSARGFGTQIVPRTLGNLSDKTLAYRIVKGRLGVYRPYMDSTPPDILLDDEEFDTREVLATSSRVDMSDGVLSINLAQSGIMTCYKFTEYGHNITFPILIDGKKLEMRTGGEFYLDGSSGILHYFYAAQPAW